MMMQQHTDTAMGRAFAKAGYSKDEMEAYGWAKQKIAQGAIPEDLLSGVKRAIRDTQRPEIWGGVDLGEEDLKSIGDEPNDRVSTSPAPQRTRKKTGGAVPQRDLRQAEADYGNTLAKTVFDTIQTHDRRPWGDVFGYELDSMEYDGSLARAIKAKVGVMTYQHRTMKVRELLKSDEFEQIIREQRGE